MTKITIDKDYSQEQYVKDINTYGLDVTWENIIEKIKSPTDEFGIISVKNFGQLYEIGLAHIDKENKKEQGQYFTPHDVAILLSKYLEKIDGENVCDVCCGTGSLILSYFEVIGEEKTKKLIKNKKIYLYDKDPLALNICKFTIGILYGNEENLNCICGDFLDKSITLPENCKVISNPPYFKITDVKSTWDKTNVLKDSKEFYSVIIEKIISNSQSSVIISPYSFLGGDKFYSLRKLMSNYNGKLISFDNVPGNIFAGKKHGVFNTNTSNSVRATITIVENKENIKGFRCSGLIRFKNTERETLLDVDALERFIGTQYQTIDEKNKKFIKCFPELEDIYRKWEKHSKPLKSYIKTKDAVSICIPNSCRYFTVASYKDLDRSGKHYINLKDNDATKIIYCFLNSSFAYWHWRLYDGGILYNKSLLESLPIIDIDKISEDNKKRLLSIADEMKSIEEKSLSYKKNAGKMQENIKFPTKYRVEINNIMLETLGFTCDSSVFDIIHSNTANTISVMEVEE